MPKMVKSRHNLNPLNKMKLKIIITVISFLAACVVNAQHDAATYFAKYVTAIKYHQGDGLPVDKEKAFRLMKECAEDGEMPEAMLKLGAMYKLGVGTSKSDKEAFNWTYKSCEKGNPEAFYPLGILYKKGIGTPQDFVEARNAFRKSAETGDPKGEYMLGYLNYRGLGGKQDYEEAVKLYRRANVQGVSAASYMLGVCYKNGYGVKKDKKKSDSFLDKAILKNYKHAAKEKQNNKTEVDIIRDNQYQEHKVSVGLFPGKVSQQSLGGNVLGEWQGKQYTFDWSKEHIIEEAELSLIVTEKNGKISGQWFENEALLCRFSGQIVDKVIVFDNAAFAAKDRLGGEVELFFTRAKLEMLVAGKNYLTGEVESYMPKVKEPGYPVYIVVEKIEDKKNAEPDTIVDKSTAIIIDNLKDTTQTGANSLNASKVQKQDAVISYIKDKELKFKVYPNPVSNILHVDYNLDKNSEVMLSVFNSNGTVVLQKDLGQEHKGLNTSSVSLGVPAGTYIVVLRVNEEAYSKVVIKK
jgi:TPR repeat protein